MRHSAETYRAAARLIDQFGADAPDLAAQWLAESLMDGNTESCRFWKEVVKTVDELLSDKTPGNTSIH